MRGAVLGSADARGCFALTFLLFCWGALPLRPSICLSLVLLYIKEKPPRRNEGPLEADGTKVLSKRTGLPLPGDELRH